MKSLNYSFFLVLVITLVVTLTGCQPGNEQQESSTSEPAIKTADTQASPATDSAVDPAITTEDDKNNEVIASINDKQLSMRDFEIYISRRMQDDPTAVNNPAAMLNELINKELLYQEAVKKGFDKREDVAIRVQQEIEGIIVGALVQEQLTDVDLSEEALKAEYDLQTADMALSEYKGRHILVATEEEAQAVIAELNLGADFIELAKSKSTGPSATQGGDLGWFQAEAMVPAFADAIKNMTKGETTKTAVKTRFGWHVIKLEDSRELNKPEYEASKERIKAILANKAAQSYLVKLREQATIDIKNPETGEATPVTTEQLDEGAAK